LVPRCAVGIHGFFVRYLVDANVLSEATKGAPMVKAVDWLRRHEHEVAVNAVVLGEIEFGILLLPSGRKRKALEEWFARVAEMLPVLEMDRETARVWAVLLARLRRKGRAMPVKDSLIAASALQHGLAVATRNTGDFAHCGVKLVDPFA
jgi:predicted nucleic acid-binding protein